MKSNPYIRIVGWGPWRLPGERRRLSEAEDAARRMVGKAADARPSGSDPGNTPSEQTGGLHDTMPGLGLTFRYQLKVKDATQCQIGFITGDILAVTTVDIWVNPENTDMEMDRHIGGSISSIIRYYGAKRGTTGRGTARVVSDVIFDQLNAAVGDAPRPVPPGSVFVTGPGELKASNNVSYVIHVASVQGEPGVGFRSLQIETLGHCVRNVLTEAESLARQNQDVHSILIPLLGTGMGRADIEPAVSVLAEAAISYLESTPGTQLRAVWFLAYDSKEYATLMSVFENDLRTTSVEDVGSIDARQ
jgi:O-acetyl-ADP-ribose deacetylase (regulator of RNase III)